MGGNEVQGSPSGGAGQQGQGSGVQGRPPARVEDEELEEEHSLIWATFCHLAGVSGFPIGNIVGPLVIWLTTRRFYPFADDHGKEAVNFQIWMTVYAMVSIVLMVLFVGFLLLPLVWVASIVFAIVAAVKANRGQPYRYPLVPVRFIS